MNKLALLQSFVRVVELASFTQAGNSLGLLKSTMSEHIQTLENVMGARLLHRTTCRVTPTQDGLVLYERARDVLASMDELDGLFHQQGPVLAGRLRVDMPTAFARREVFPRLGEFLQAHPAIQVEIGCTDRRVAVVREDFDCLVRIGQLNDANLVARRLGKLRRVNCALGLLAGPGHTRHPCRPGSSCLDRLCPRFGVAIDGICLSTTGPQCQPPNARPGHGE